MKTLQQRIEHLTRDLPRGWQAKLARHVGISPPSVADWKNGKTDTVEWEHAKKAGEFFRVNPEWFRSGKGPISADTDDIDQGDDSVSFTHLDDSPPPTMQPILSWDHEDDLPPGEFVMIPRLAVHLSAGNGHEQTEIEFVKKQPQAFRADWIRQKRLKPAKLAAMSASGNSMEPRIWDGDSVVVDTSQTNVVDGKVYALWYDGGERVKRLFRLPGGGLRIRSDNPAFESIELAASEVDHVRILGRVVQISGDGGL